eukprot:gene1950-biopygen7676
MLCLCRSLWADVADNGSRNSSWRTVWPDCACTALCDHSGNTMCHTSEWCQHCWRTESITHCARPCAPTVPCTLPWRTSAPPCARTALCNHSGENMCHTSEWCQHCWRTAFITHCARPCADSAVHATIACFCIPLCTHSVV